MKTYRAAVRDYPHTTPVKSGEHPPAGARLEFAEIDPIHKAFAPMVRELRFDFSELALATGLQAWEAGKELSFLPVVLHGNFHHGSLFRLTGNDVRNPKDLEGKRVGVRSYTQTTGLWVRGVLAEEYGVDCDAITWVTTEEPHVSEYAEPANVERSSGKLVDLLQAGDISALVIGPRAVPEGAPVEQLLPDAKAAAQAWSQRHGTVPINHLLTVRTDVLRNDPEAVRGVYDAFAAEIDAKTSGEAGPHRIGHGLTDSVRASLEIGIRYAAQQHLITREPTVDELFADYLTLR
ncbi:hypothetical protein FPZ12_026415 [Amycolatopsis acidicola]|uniref:ABC transporter substrate-binding protein n=1 Tax=Amycolatopsis acidicola TaxID=2596893 RepID=A0A5N0UZT0_9PSEU|nr:hypothetical protein [Amycolatopsis acidicola]KAA9156953.1 hypothetical protein FPZ12_026415 [Amycolatopsis acidicola]